MQLIRVFIVGCESSRVVTIGASMRLRFYFIQFLIFGTL